MKAILFPPMALGYMAVDCCRLDYAELGELLVLSLLVKLYRGWLIAISCVQSYLLGSDTPQETFLLGDATLLLLTNR